jgi:signal transduction histidine kinase
VAEAADAVVHMILPQARSKGLDLQLQCGDDLVAVADRAKFEQILLNLLSNAVKFTDSGGSILVRCQAMEVDRVLISVRDTGIGIPADHLETIFEPFVQVGRSLTSTREGTGLGLAISRDLARAMDGDITVASTVDRGSEFRVSLPRAKPA